MGSSPTFGTTVSSVGRAAVEIQDRTLDAIDEALDTFRERMRATEKKRIDWEVRYLPVAPAPTAAMAKCRREAGATCAAPRRRA